MDILKNCRVGFLSYLFISSLWSYVTGCKIGYFGTQCDQECRSPNYGYRCQSECQCLDKDCDHIYGCKYNSSEKSNGYHESITFRTNAAIGTSPEKSNKTEMQKLTQQTITKPNFNIKTENVVHSKGCEKGYYGKSCEHKCRYPNFGLRCQSRCNCENNSCNHVDGCTDVTEGNSRCEKETSATIHFLPALIGVIVLASLIAVSYTHITLHMDTVDHEHQHVIHIV